LRAVIANDGAPGIDGMRTEELNGHLLQHGPKIQAKRIAGSYVPSPVRRKEIRKENGGGPRRLGIPTVLDLRHGPATGGSSSRCCCRP
jgi:RNA-directed DNA polymerase